MRVTAKASSAYPWYLRPFFWSQRRKYGAVLDSALLWARSPRIFLGVALLYGAIDRKSSPVPPALRPLLTVRVSQLNACRFCVDLNSATLLRRGVAVEKVVALAAWPASNLFSAQERAHRPDRLPEHVQQVQQRTCRSATGVLQAAGGGRGHHLSWTHAEQG